MGNNSRTENSKKNVLIGLFNKIVLLLLAFVNRRFFLQYIGAEYLGINGLFTEILGMLSLADLGFGTAMAYSFYKPIAENDEEKLCQLITFYRKVYTTIAIAVAVLGMAFVPFLRYIVNTEVEIQNLELYYIIFLANTVFSYLFAYKGAIIGASQKQYIVSKYGIYFNVFKTISQFLVVVFLHSYTVYISINIIITIANNLLVSYKANQLYPIIREKKELPKEEKKSIFSNLGSVFLYKIAGVLLNSTDNTLISIVCGTVFVGYYSNYNTITTNVTAFITIIFTSLTPSIGNLIVAGQHSQRLKIFKVMQMVSFWLATVCSLELYFLMNPFIEEIWLGTDKYLFNQFTVLAIIINFYLSTTLQPLWSYREATGLYRRTRFVMLVTAGVNIVFSVILGKWLGVGGIIFASFIAKISTYVWYEPLILFKEYFNESAFYYYKIQIVNAIIACLCLFVLGYIISFVNIHGFIGLLLKALIIGLLITIVYFIKYYKTEEFVTIKSKIIKNRG